MSEVTMTTISARDLMVPAQEIVSVGLATSLDEARNTAAGVAVTLVTDASQLVGVLGTRALQSARGLDGSMETLMQVLDPATLTGPDASASQLYASLRDAANLWHVVYESGELVGIVPPVRLVQSAELAFTADIASGGLFGEPDGIPDEWLCCTGASPHCFSAVEASRLGLDPGSACPRSDGAVLRRQTRS
jgi:hypothetical protein